MRYALFDNMSAAIVERSPVVVKDCLVLQFTGAQDGAVAVFQNGNVTYYEEITDGACMLRASACVGVVSVGVKVIAEKVTEWACEGLRGTLLESGEILVTPDDNNLPQEFVRLRQENQEMRKNISSLEEKNSALMQRLDDMMAGWAIT